MKLYSGLCAAITGGALGWLVADSFTKGNVTGGVIALVGVMAYWGYIFTR